MRFLTAQPITRWECRSEDHRKIQPALAGTYVADIAELFLVLLICHEVTVQQVRRTSEHMVAIRGRLEFAFSFSDDLIFTRQPPNPTVADINADFLQFFGHPRAAAAARGQARLLLDVRQNDHFHVMSAAAKRPHTAWTDVHHLTQPIDQERFASKP
jgi:hypothetical protein